MIQPRIFKVLSLLFTAILFPSCECSNSSGAHHNYSDPYNSYSQQPIMPQNNNLNEEHLKEILKQLQLSTLPKQRQRIQRSEDWDRGYGYGWDVGYLDAIDGIGAWANYDSSGKGGDFLDGYENGYIDGYESGRDDREDKGRGIEKL